MKKRSYIIGLIIVIICVSSCACSFVLPSPTNSTVLNWHDNKTTSPNAPLKVTISDTIPVLTFDISKTDKTEQKSDLLLYTYQIAVSCQKNPALISQKFQVKSSIDSDCSGDYNFISFVDIDYDGYSDIEVETVRGNGLITREFYRWKSMLNKYEESPFFELRCGSYKIFPDTKQIITTTSSGAVSYSRSMYQLIDGTYIQVRGEDTDTILKDDGLYEFAPNSVEIGSDSSEYSLINCTHSKLQRRSCHNERISEK
jgi:hypothetical protein